MAQNLPVSDMTEDQAALELQRLALALAQANRAYHRDDNPSIDDATYDWFKLRNAQIEQKFPHLKRTDSPSDQVQDFNFNKIYSQFSCFYKSLTKNKKLAVILKQENWLLFKKKTN